MATILISSHYNLPTADQFLISLENFVFLWSRNSNNIVGYFQLKCYLKDEFSLIKNKKISIFWKYWHALLSGKNNYQKRFPFLFITFFYTTECNILLHFECIAVLSDIFAIFFYFSLTQNWKKATSDIEKNIYIYIFLHIQ